MNSTGTAGDPWKLPKPPVRYGYLVVRAGQGPGFTGAPVVSYDDGETWTRAVTTTGPPQFQQTTGSGSRPNTLHDRHSHAARITELSPPSRDPGRLGSHT